jgi:hypothetical protein
MSQSKSRVYIQFYENQIKVSRLDTQEIQVMLIKFTLRNEIDFRR